MPQSYALLFVSTKSKQKRFSILFLTAEKETNKLPARVHKKQSLRSVFIRNLVVTKQQIPDYNLPEWRGAWFQKDIARDSQITTITPFIKPSSRSVLIRDLVVTKPQSPDYNPPTWHNCVSGQNSKNGRKIIFARSTNYAVNTSRYLTLTLKAMSSRKLLCTGHSCAACA